VVGILGGLRRWLLGFHALNEKRENWFGPYRSSGSPEGSAGGTSCSGAVPLPWGHGSLGTLREYDTKGHLSCTSTVAAAQGTAVWHLMVQNTCGMSFCMCVLSVQAAAAEV